MSNTDRQTSRDITKSKTEQQEEEIDEKHLSVPEAWRIRNPAEFRKYEEKQTREE